jgi:hypothetical protein
MRDILFPFVLVAFFVVTTLLVKACDRLIEPRSSDRGSVELS